MSTNRELRLIATGKASSAHVKILGIGYSFTYYIIIIISSTILHYDLVSDSMKCFDAECDAYSQA